MIHEFINLIIAYQKLNQLGIRSVLASVVELDGSSYRRPGVRMLINENGQFTGAVSGGCVEKEILKQSAYVFKTGKPKMMTYDGRYRLGCEGTLYILIELFDPSREFITSFENCLKERTHFEIKSLYTKETGDAGELGSVVVFSNKKQYSFNKSYGPKNDKNTLTKVFNQKIKPLFKLIIIGAEHDAKQLCLLASSLGWEVLVVTSPSDPQTLKDFPDATDLIHKVPEDLELSWIDENVAIVLMTHSYVKDLQYLIALIDTKPAYIGLLGPSNRRERILNDVIERIPTVDESLFDVIYGPAGLNIGAETPQEISMSICSEILAVIRDQEPKSLKNKSGKIHLDISL